MISLRGTFSGSGATRVRREGRVHAGTPKKRSISVQVEAVIVTSKDIFRRLKQVKTRLMSMLTSAATVTAIKSLPTGSSLKLPTGVPRES